MNTIEVAQIRSGSVAVTVSLCFAVAMLEGFDIQAMGIAAPKLAPAFGLSAPQLGWVFSMSNVGLLIGAALGGRLSDRVGRKAILVWSVACFGLFTALTVFVSDFAGLFLVRFGAGLGFGAALPNMMALAVDISRPERRSSTTVAIFCGMPLGGGLAALVAQTLPAGSDWRMLFIIGGILPLLLIPLLIWFMRDTRPAPHGTEHPPREAVLTILFGAGRAPATLLLWLALFSTVLIIYLLLNWLPTLAVARGLSATVAPATALASNLGAFVGALTLGALVDRFGVRWPFALAYAALGAALFMLAHAQGAVMIIALSGLCGFLVVGTNYALYSVAASQYHEAIRGTGSGAAVAVSRFGSVVGPLLGGLLIGMGASASTVIVVMTPFALVAGAAIVALTILGTKSASVRF